MIDALKRLFASRIEGPAATESPASREQALRLAAAVLLFEIVRADAVVKDAELAVMRASLQSAFDLSPEQADEMMRLAEEESRSASSLYEFTSRVDAELAPEQKKRIVELLWLVAFADGAKDAHEEHLVRRIAGLLHVPHPDFIDAKLRAREGSTG
jgi:uncharacterized tellurite resistance protein B-like protein